MIITAVDSKKNIFSVENVYPQELIDACLKEDPFSYEFEREEGQEQSPRRKLIIPDASPFAELNRHLLKNIDAISDNIGVKLTGCATAVWVDYPGFTSSVHLDNFRVRIAMQVYLNNNEVFLGTKFYNNNGTLRYSTPYKLNTGYLNINNDHKQWHGMTNPIPKDTYRISSYTWFVPESWQDLPDISNSLPIPVVKK